jgi:hypothetical protein
MFRHTTLYAEHCSLACTTGPPKVPPVRVFRTVDRLEISARQSALSNPGGCACHWWDGRVASSRAPRRNFAHMNVIVRVERPAAPQKRKIWSRNSFELPITAGVLIRDVLHLLLRIGNGLGTPSGSWKEWRAGDTAWVIRIRLLSVFPQISMAPHKLLYDSTNHVMDQCSEDCPASGSSEISALCIYIIVFDS